MALKKSFWVLVFCTLFAVPAWAQAEMAVVNVDRVLTTTKAAKNIEKQMQSKREEYQKEFSTRERELRGVQEKLVQEKSSLGEEEFDSKRKDFEKKLAETKKLFDKRRGALNKAFSKATGRLQKEMFETVADIAEKEGYKIIFDRKSVVIVEESLDITDRVVASIDKSLPDVKLEVEP